LKRAHPFYLAVIAVAIAGCSQFDKSTLLPVSADMSKPVYPQRRAVVNPGDGIFFRFTNHPDLNTHGYVELDGTFILPMVGTITVAGKSTREIREEITPLYEHELKQVDIVVTTEKPDGMVFVCGEINQGGVIPFRTNMTVAQVMAAAHPNMVTGDVRSTILVRKDENDPNVYNSYLVNGDFANGDARNIYVSPGDVVIIPRKGIAMAGDFVRMYVKDLLPTNTSINYNWVQEVNRASGNAINW
jgi:protein involved in polysaccharide export with SLBB domain